MFKLQFKDNPSKSIWLVGEKVTLGSHSTNTMVLDGLGIDEFHAELFIEPNQLILKSKPGSCIVNDLPVDGEHTLHANDELRIGKERLLIIDPRNPPVPKPKPGSARAATKAADWKLVPEHSKLSDQDFSIHDRAVLGRSKDCEFSVPYKLLSREHAEMWLEDGNLYVRDLNSANGCFVNGQRIQEALLKSGDKLAFAKLAFTVKGPEGSADSAAAGAGKVGEEELNRTQMRPAIQIDEASLLAPSDSGGESLSLELGDQAGEDKAGRDSAAGGSGGKIIVFAIALIVVAAGVAWYVLQS